MTNLLFTSVGRRVELLRAFRNAYQSLGLEGSIVALDIDPLAPALQFADKPYIVPRLDTAEYIPTLVEICQREKIGAIFPLIDPDISVLANHRQAIEETGARLAVVSSQAANIAGDKWQTYQFFQSLSLTTPRSWLPNQTNPSRMHYPLFVKPRAGSASKNAFKVSDEKELLFFSEYIDDAVIQEYLSGPEVTSDVICDLDGEVLAVVSRQRIEVRWGEVAKGVTVYYPVITKACLAVARALPAIGPITVQCIMKGDTPYFTEINARLGGGIPLGIAAGANSPAWLLSRLAKIPMEIPSLGSYRTGLYLTRYDDSIYLSEENRAQMASNHI